MTSKKHYNAVAKLLLFHVNVAQGNEDGDSLSTIQSIADSLSHVFGDDNPRFDRARFLKAAGLAANDESEVA